MKPNFLLAIVVTLCATVAVADSFTVIRDGREYLCSPTGSSQPPNPGGGAVDCVNKAYSGPFSRDESMQLCSGALNVGPALCAIKAYAGPFNRAEAIELCARSGTEAHAECAIKAYAGPYSRAEAIQLCKAQPSLMLRSLKLMEKSPEVQSQIHLLKTQRSL
jgi:hypothetical protein